MKKFLLLLVCAGLSVSAWAYRSQMKNAEQKIKTLTLLEERAFDWEDEYYSPEYEELVQLAKHVHKQNPASFNAAYNYGLLRYATFENEIGPNASDKDLKTAFEAFERAREIVPHNPMLVEREYDVLKNLLIGADVPTRLLFNEDIFEIYQHNPIYAQKFVEVITHAFQLKEMNAGKTSPKVNEDFQDWSDRALQAFLIRLAQKEYDKAAIWLERLGGKDELKELWMGDHSDEYAISKRNESPKYWISLQARYNEALSHVGIDVKAWHKELKERKEGPAKRFINNLQKSFK